MNFMNMELLLRDGKISQHVLQTQSVHALQVGGDLVH